MMNSTLQRKILLPLIEQAVADGARLQQASTQIGLSARTVQRWQHPCAQEGDRRVSTLRVYLAPPNKLSQIERDAAMQVLNSEEFKDLKAQLLQLQPIRWAAIKKYFQKFKY